MGAIKANLASIAVTVSEIIRIIKDNNLLISVLKLIEDLLFISISLLGKNTKLSKPNNLSVRKLKPFYTIMEIRLYDTGSLVHKFQGFR